MASRRISTPAKHLFNGFRHACRQQQRYTAKRTLTTEATASTTTTTPPPISPIEPASITTDPTSQHPQQYRPPPNPFLKTAQCTLHAFPALEPTSLAAYPGTHLLLPLRKDILHRAIVYEGDVSRQGSANTQHRTEVHGSNRKLRPQKGTGMARLGNKKSPMLRGGGVAHGPKPRDHSTGLQKQVYDLAWRTALSYRYSRGELIVLDSSAALPEELHEESRERWMRDLLVYHNLGNRHGRSLFVTRRHVPSLWDALRGSKTYGIRHKKVKDTVGDSREARAVTVEEVDVKDLLELGRVVVEKPALDLLMGRHESDLGPTQKLRAWREKMGS